MHWLSISQQTTDLSSAFIQTAHRNLAPIGPVEPLWSRRGAAVGGAGVCWGWGGGGLALTGSGKRFSFAAQKAGNH